MLRRLQILREGALVAVCLSLEAPSLQAWAQRGIQLLRPAFFLGPKNRLFLIPWFILFFLLAAIISTVFNLNPYTTKSISDMGKFFITMAMGAIGLNTNIIKLIKTGGKPIIIGLCCWISIAFVSLLMQQLLHIW